MVTKIAARFIDIPPYKFPNQMLAVGQQCRQPCEAHLEEQYCSLVVQGAAKSGTHSGARRIRLRQPSNTQSSLLGCVMHTCQKSLAMPWGTLFDKKAAGGSNSGLVINTQSICMNGLKTELHSSGQTSSSQAGRLGRREPCSQESGIPTNRSFIWRISEPKDQLFAKLQQSPIWVPHPCRSLIAAWVGDHNPYLHQTHESPSSPRGFQYLWKG